MVDRPAYVLTRTNRLHVQCIGPCCSLNKEIARILTNISSNNMTKFPRDSNAISETDDTIIGSLGNL